MNKKVVSIVAIIALVAILGVCLVACNADNHAKMLDYVKKLEDKGYYVEKYPSEELDAYREYYGVDVKWGISGRKGTDLYSSDSVGIFAFADADDAKALAIMLNTAELYDYVEVKDKIVFFGTEQGIIDARYPVL